MAKKPVYRIHYKTYGTAEIAASDAWKASERFKRNPARFVKVKDMTVFEYRSVEDKKKGDFPVLLAEVQRLDKRGKPAKKRPFGLHEDGFI